MTTKIEQSILLYRQHKPATLESFVDILMNELLLSESVAKTYAYMIRKKEGNLPSGNKRGRPRKNPEVVTAPKVVRPASRQKKKASEPVAIVVDIGTEEGDKPAVPINAIMGEQSGDQRKALYAEKYPESDFVPFVGTENIDSADVPEFIKSRFKI